MGTFDGCTVGCFVGTLEDGTFEGEAEGEAVVACAIKSRRPNSVE